MHFTHRSHNQLPSRTFDYKNMAWAVVLIGATVGLMHFTISRPMQRQISDLGEELGRTRAQMQTLTGWESEVWQSNNLLTCLRVQADQLQKSRHSLQSLRDYREQVDAEIARVRQSQETLAGLVKLQDNLLASQELNVAASSSLEQMIALQRQVAVQPSLTEQATEAAKQWADFTTSVVSQSAEVEDARKALDRLIDLKKGAVEQLADVKEALGHFGEAVKLQEVINQNGPQFKQARNNTDELLALQDELVKHGEKAQTARQQATRLLELSDQLNSDNLDPQTAQKNLNVLVDIQDRLANNSQQVIAAVESFELLADFLSEMNAHISSMDGLRRNLVEIAMMENSLTRAMRVLQPLAELADLRRMNPEQVREAARMILESRSATRLSSNRDKYQPTSTEQSFKSLAGEKNFAKDLFGEPQAETFVDRLVPWTPTEADDTP